MRFGIVGLGRIGGNLARQALEKGHQPVVFDRAPELVRELEQEGAEAAYSYEEIAQKLSVPRLVLVYVPAGPVVDEVLTALASTLEPRDLVVDGGNSHWKDSQRRHAELNQRGIRYVDCGTSGGVNGARNGACFMAGGDAQDVAKVAPLLRDLSVPGGFVHAGPAGAGHFTKLIHNAIEFGMVQAIAEGTEMLAKSEYDLDLPTLFDAWNHGSIIESRLVELMREGLTEQGGLENVSSWVEDTKEGKWYVQYALEREVHAPVLTLSEMMFYRYRDPESIAGKAVALMRHGFGQHPLYGRERAPGQPAGRP